MERRFKNFLRWLAVIFLALTGCAHMPDCASSKPSLLVPALVKAEPRQITFLFDIPEDGSAVWVEYGTDLNNMGYMSNGRKPGENSIVIANLRPGKTYYWRLVLRGACGTVSGPRSSVKTPLK